MSIDKDSNRLQQNRRNGSTLTEQQVTIAEKDNTVKKVVIIITIIVVTAAAVWSLWKLFIKEDKPSDTLVFTVGTEEVYLDEVNFCLVQNVLDYGLTAENIQSATAEDGTDSATYYKQATLQWIMDYKVEYLTAKEQGITLTEEEEEEVQKNVVECLNRIDGRLLNCYGIERDVIEEVYTQCYLAQKLEETIVTDVELEEQKYCTMYIMLFPIIEMQDDGSYVTAEDGMTPILLSDVEIQQRKKDAESALVELRDGAEPEEVAEQYGVAAYSAEKSNLTGSFEEPFIQYAESLKAGECSPIIEIESCYGIVKMIDDNNEELAEQIMGYYKADLEKEALQKQRTKWYEQMGIGQTPEFKGRIWEKISLYDFVQGMEE